jgi:DtxR family Mn-dependent transcriptional regulator
MPAGEPAALPDSLSASLEHYVRAIHDLTHRQGGARAGDIAAVLDVSGASVTGALRSLAQKGVVNYAPYDVVTLTALGERIAHDLIQRRETVLSFLTRVLSVPPEEAFTNACRIEHVISNEVMERLTRFVRFLEMCPRTGDAWIKGQGYFCSHNEMSESCARCVASGGVNQDDEDPCRQDRGDDR